MGLKYYLTVKNKFIYKHLRKNKVVKFSCEQSDKNNARYALTEDGATLATVETEGDTIKSVSFCNKSAENMYRDFSLRSAVFLLREKFPQVKAAFTDPLLEVLGFVPYENGMKADSIKIRFDNCCHGGCNK